ncbi:hypothetical protein [Mycolicibacterium frederiksbergense]|uniref:Uncharacterized protein n=1 Tax=Mycolicibacterium frederiksbergense TaxID=117567 RepID=A0A6H0RXS6_9MYCO|nr:hypothetical protein [Mycolicibacterium frederiksbergense]QIV79716.1 hypothetical protein EXE63_01475 [Mycolicibacterium frederiksbergense]
MDTARRQLFGDLDHEICTPVAVLGTVVDGVRPLTLDTIAVMRAQPRRLVRFAGDLSALARAEEGAATMSVTGLDVADLVTRAVAAITDCCLAKRRVPVDPPVDVSARCGGGRARGFT